jgi:hypothetical protein
MKTNVVLESKDRELFGITIKQETKTGFLSISELQKAYEVARWEFGWSQLDISSLMQSAKMVERVYYLLKDRDLIKTELSAFIEMCKNEGITKVLKSLGVWKTTGARTNKQVMCDPYVWVSIALELNPMIYAKVITFITDTLVFDRIEAGTEYRPMNDAIKIIVQNPEYYKYAIAINNRVFGKHFTGMRDLASSADLKKIAEIEKYLIKIISSGLIKTESEIFKAIETF